MITRALAIPMYRSTPWACQPSKFLPGTPGSAWEDESCVEQLPRLSILVTLPRHGVRKVAVGRHHAPGREAELLRASVCTRVKRFRWRPRDRLHISTSHRAQRGCWFRCPAAEINEWAIVTLANSIF